MAAGTFGTVSNSGEVMSVTKADEIGKSVTELNARIAVLEKINENHETHVAQIQKTVHDVEELRKDFEEHKNHGQQLIEQVKKDSFPNGDPLGHRTFHETEMEKRKSFADIKKEVIAHVAKGAIWALVVALFWAGVYAFKEWIKTAK